MFTPGQGINPYWFIGEVVDKDDPTNSGRIRVRAVGIHPPAGNYIKNDKIEKNYVEDQDLPWAQIVNGTMGKMHAVPDEGDWVFGFFADGRDAQHPFILGTLYGQNTDDNGLSDPPPDQDTSSNGAVVPLVPGAVIDTDHDVVEILEVGRGYNVVRLEDGTVVRRVGDRNWRNNNPGNIEYGPFAQRLGAIGSDGRFAIFPNYETGRAAKENLLFETSSYRNLSLADAINRYAPPSENDTTSYIRNVASAAGVSSGTRMSEMTSSQRQTILNAIEKQEGFRQGTSTIYG